MQRNNNKKYASISQSVLLYMAWRNLTTKKLRSALTITGVAVGIGSIFFLLSFGLGLQNLVTNQLIGNQSIKSIDVTSQNSKIVRLDSAIVERISGLPKVDKLGVSYSMAGKMKIDKSELQIVAYGIDTNYQDLSNLPLSAGRSLTKDDKNSVLISRSSLEALNLEEASQAIGMSADINIPIKQNGSGDFGNIDKSFEIVGVINSNYGSEVFLSNRVFEQSSVDQYSQIKLSTEDASNVSVLRTQIESMGLNTSSPADTIDEVNQIFGYFNAILLGFGLIGMIIAILGMFNTLTVSLLERTGEIGLLFSLGGRHSDMRKLFIYEAMLLSLAGAIAGIAITLVLEVVINIIVNQIVFSRGFEGSIDLFATPFWLIVGQIVFMSIVGLVVAQMPARRAGKINPIDSLKQH